MWNEMRKTFITGLLVLAPITLTLYIFFLLFRFIDSILNNVVTKFLVDTIGLTQFKTTIPGLGILALLVLIFLSGTIARNYVGRKVFNLGDYIVTHIPLINRTYIAIREFSEAILGEKREVFKKAVLIQYPRKGLYSIAFFTQDTKGPVQNTLKEDVVSVIIPTTPNPTSGYLLFVPKKDVLELDMPVEDALKLVISGGSIHLKDHHSLKPLFSPRKIKKKRGEHRIFSSTKYKNRSKGHQ
jgi:uncharacterized membrane protein